MLKFCFYWAYVKMRNQSFYTLRDPDHVCLSFYVSVIRSVTSVACARPPAATFLSPTVIPKLPQGLKWVKWFLCFLTHVGKRQRNKLTTCRSPLLFAKHVPFYSLQSIFSSWHITHNSSIAGSDATPCKLIFTRTRARLPFICLPLTNSLF